MDIPGFPMVTRGMTGGADRLYGSHVHPNARGQPEVRMPLQELEMKSGLSSTQSGLLGSARRVMREPGCV